MTRTRYSNGNVHLIAEFAYQNGRFGRNVAAIWRRRPTEWMRGGYSVGNGGTDPMFYTSAVEAKNAFRRIVQAEAN